MKKIINENDPRVIKTRRLLLDSFVVLVRKKDFTSISVKDITDSAQVNRATFYAHFQDKYDILEYMVMLYPLLILSLTLFRCSVIWMT